MPVEVIDRSVVHTSKYTAMSEPTRFPGTSSAAAARAPPPAAGFASATRAPFGATGHPGATPASGLGTGAVPAAAAASLPPRAAMGPEYSLEEGKHVRRLRIGAWEVESAKRPILNGREIEALEKELRLPLPEMTFGHNALLLRHPRLQLSFDTLGALRAVSVGEGWEARDGGGVLVSMADKWKDRKVEGEDVAAKPVRPHDWTFSSCFKGAAGGRLKHSVHVADVQDFAPSSTHEIPLALLARQDPVLDRILFYDDVALYEDELHDHGESMLNVRIRVMPHSFFILSRLFVRVDSVLFRIFDVRVFHSFGANEVVRETAGLEAPYDAVKSYLENPEDLSPLTDANFVHATLKKIQDGVPPPASRRRQSPLPTATRATMPSRVTATPPSPSPASTPTPGQQQGKGKPWPGLGKVVEVLHLEDIEQGVRDLSL